MIGGNLGVGEMNEEELVPRFQNYGFDLVFHQTDLNEGLDQLEAFLKTHKNGEKS